MGEEKEVRPLEKQTFPEITEKEAREQYKIYPDFELLDNKMTVVTYIITHNDYLAPLKMDMNREVINIHELRGFLQLFENTANSVRQKFNGWNHFGGKSNYIYPNGYVVNIKKIVK